MVFESQGRARVADILQGVKIAGSKPRLATGVPPSLGGSAK